MDRARYDEFVKTFFDCDIKTLTQIFQELLTAMTAEESMPPGRYMSPNYETARENPDIHPLPGNLKDARDAIFPYFWGTDGWSSKLHLENVRGPANYASLIGAIACLLKNPNLCTDSYSQRSNELEVKSITALANLLFRPACEPWGVFTMGGTLSNMYAAKIGIEKVVPEAMQRGLREANVAGICSQAAHYCASTIAGWLGMGMENLHQIETDRNQEMRLDKLANKLDELYAQGVKIAFVIATFVTTDAGGIDDVAAIRSIINEKAAKYGMPTPHLHADAAIGWGLAFLNDYDLERNSLRLDPGVLPIIAKAQRSCAGLAAADSVTLDFHKTGRGHYPSSAFIVNRRSEMKYLMRSKESVPYFPEADARRDPGLFTFETSRSAIGPYTVTASLQGIGTVGWQMLMARSMELASYFKKKLEKLDYCLVLNKESVGTNVVFWVLPRGRNAKEIFAALEAGRLSLEEAQRTFAEVRRLYAKREKSLDPALDARLSLTTNIGYHPCGHDLPAWKAAFFNPKTDEPVVDRLIEGIEETA